jgi:hypothetical protein
MVTTREMLHENILAREVHDIRILPLSQIQARRGLGEHSSIPSDSSVDARVVNLDSMIGEFFEGFRMGHR